MKKCGMASRKRVDSEQLNDIVDNNGKMLN
jgi:hypothetical protein